MTLKEFFVALEDMIFKKSLRGDFYLDAGFYLRNRYGTECPICALANVRLPKDEYKNADAIEAGASIGLTKTDCQLIIDAADSRNWKYPFTSVQSKKILAVRKVLWRICGVGQ